MVKLDKIFSKERFFSIIFGDDKMPMNIIIQEKRKAIGLTQEQIGEYLGVSTPAVNKWEKGYTYPDISLLPALARLLKVDLNTLLCFNEGLTEQEINNFSSEVVDVIKTNGFEAGFTMSMEKIQQYPNCDKLIYTIALLLDGALLMYGANTSLEDKEAYKKQTTALYERAAKSDNDQIREKAIYMVVSKYLAGTDYEKTQELIDLLPEKNTLDKAKLQARLFIKQDKRHEAAKILERKLFNVVNEVQMILMNLAEIEIKEGDSAKASHLAEISHKVAKLFEHGDMQAIAIPLHFAIIQKNVEDSISLLKAYFSATFTPWDVSKSSLYCHMELNLKTSKKEVVKEEQENLGKQVRLALISELENSPEYIFLHSNPEFQQLIEYFRTKS